MVINLVWIEDQTDEAATRERARILKDMGFEEGVKVLARDQDLDVRERAKTAVDLLARLTGSGEVGGAEGRGGRGGATATGFASSGQPFGEMRGLGGLSGWRHDAGRG